MNTPILDFVKKYATGDISRFHMPGHKGKDFIGCERLDITEICGADVLYSPDGIIAESEDNATRLFWSGHTFYSAEGSSLCIKAMLYLASMGARNGKKRPTVLASRNAHKSFIYACALLDLDVKWLYPKEKKHLCSCNISAREVEDAISDDIFAVYVTSPDYLGSIADISGISSVCKRKGIPLLVDNAHGAYLGFLSPSLHPIALGADMCCDSAHKTLPVLTGGAYLHVSSAADSFYISEARSALSLFASTSPSYLILQSLDSCNAYLSDGYRDRLSECIGRINEIKAFISKRGFYVERSEPLKITVNAARSGYTGDELSDILRSNRIECEFSDDSLLVLMITPENSDKDLKRLKDVFSTLTPKPAIIYDGGLFPEEAESAMTVREAILARSETVSVNDAMGRICASPTVSCPPAIPIVVSGERISTKAVELFKRYKIEKIKVVST